MAKCQGHRIPRTYLKVTALALLAEVFGVCDFDPSLLQPRETVQLQGELTCGPQSVKQMSNICVMDITIRVITWRVEDLCTLHTEQS